MLLPGEKIEKNLFKDIAYPTYSIGSDKSTIERSYVAKSGHVGVLVVTAKNVTISKNTYPTLMRLPEEFWPKYQTFGILYRIGWSQYIDCYITQNGYVILNSPNDINAGNIVGNISFAIE
jgi:hypothetical protein